MKKRLSLKALLLSAVLFAWPADAVVLTIDQVALHARNAGFYGGSLVSAIVGAEAESGFDTDAVNNNVHITTAGGDIIPGPNGQPLLASLPTTGRVMHPVGSIQRLPDGRYGKVVSHCRGLWQFNNAVHSRWPTDAQAFDPAAAARCAYAISRHGRDMGKWVVMQNGAAWQPARLARARAAAVARDTNVLRGTGNERAVARVTGGAIRATPGGARIRALHYGDTGRVLAEPTLAAITQGRQTSTKLWWQIQWDSGHTGWASEDLLMKSYALDLQPAGPAFSGAPHGITGVKHDTSLTWCTGPNTASQRLYLGTTPIPGAADLKFTGLASEWRPTVPLQPYTRYYWRVDTVSGQNAVIPGPVWNFLTRPPAAAAVVLENVSTAPQVLQPGFNTVITCRTRSPAGQPVLVGASLHRTGATPISDPPNDVPRFAPAGTGSFTRNFTLPVSTPPGGYTLLVRLVQDYNANGDIDPSEIVIAESRTPVSVTPAGPLVQNLSVSPQTMAPGQSAVISADVTALPGSSLGLLKLFRAEGATAPGPWTQVQTRNMNNNAQYAAQFTDFPPSIRRYWYAVQAFDNLNRGAPDGPYFRPVSVLVTLGDSRPPVLVWNSPADGSAVSSALQFSGTLTDNDIIESAAFSTDGAPWQSLGSGNWSLIPAPEAGPHSITIRATDRSGNTVQETRQYYVRPQPGGSDFDEDQPFTGSSDHNPFWLLSVQNGAALANGRIGTDGDGSSFALSRFKRPPLWAQSLEISFQCGPEGGGFRWDRNFFDTVMVRLVRTGPSQWVLRSGLQNSAQDTLLTVASLPESARISILARLEDRQLYCRAVSADASAAVLGESLQTLPNLTMSELQTIDFTGAGTAAADMWLDDLSFRALRAGNGLRAGNVSVLSPAGTQRNAAISWQTLPGRTCQLEVQDPLTRAWSRTDAPVTATGLIESRTLSFPKTRPSVFLRVRQLLP